MGYMISARGIEANLDKCRAIIEMKSPANVLEVQRLNGKLASLQDSYPRVQEDHRHFLNASRRPWCLNGLMSVNNHSKV